MTRYYYTCPIKASYMAKEFGVRIYLDIAKKSGKSISSIQYPIEVPNLGTNRFQLKIFAKTDGSNENDFEWEDTGEQEYLTYTDAEDKLYVAPESENIFELEQGDIGIERNLHSTETCYFGGKYWAYQNEELQTKPHQQRVKIIYRDGKEFFMPEVEND